MRVVRRYSPRTCSIYEEVLAGFCAFSGCDGSPESLSECLTVSGVRSYEVHLMDDLSESPRTVGLHLSVLSGFCRFLMKEKVLTSNPVRLISRPKVPKRLPAYYRDESMASYFDSTACDAGEESLDLMRSLPSDDPMVKDLYERRLRRLIVSVLSGTGIRRAELIGLDVMSVDFSRHILKVRGKGDKMRDVPMVEGLLDEISLYLDACLHLLGDNPPAGPLLRTAAGARLYPVYVDRAVKAALSGVEGITGRKSPHVLRHTIATELLGEGADINAIKELLGHANLAATQVYTHNSIEKMRKVYSAAHPRAKSEE